MDALKKMMLEKKVWAVVGANTKKDKFGYKLFKILKDNGYEVYPVNPNYEEIEGEKCYKSLMEIPKKVECVDVVVNPKLGLSLIDDVARLGIENIWFQPGSADDQVIDKAESLIKNVVYFECVLAELRKK